MLRRAITGLLAGAVASAPLEAFARPAVLVDLDSSRIYYAEDLDHRWHPASLTKIMTAYITFEALKAGEIKIDGKVIATENSTLQPPSKIGLPVNGQISIELAIKALIIKSANDVAMMLAEGISGSEAAFVERMNKTAARLGMSRTKFVNPNGLPAAEQVTTARDLAKLSRAIIKDFPEYAQYWSLVDMQIGRRRIGTHNSLLKTYEGADGLKTGFICDSGYNVVATATRDGRRLIAVVLGESNSRDRAIRASSLLEHGFQTSGWKAMFNTQTLEDTALAADAADVISIRNEVRSRACGGRGGPPRVAKARQDAQKRRLKQAKATPGTPAAAPAPAATGDATPAAVAKPKAKAKAAVTTE
jgi:D-alanyl-D-alanine carboxypeptidase